MSASSLSDMSDPEIISAAPPKRVATLDPEDSAANVSYPAYDIEPDAPVPSTKADFASGSWGADLPSVSSPLTAPNHHPQRSLRKQTSSELRQERIILDSLQHGLSQGPHAARDVEERTEQLSSLPMALREPLQSTLTALSRQPGHRLLEAHEQTCPSAFLITPDIPQHRLRWLATSGQTQGPKDPALPNALEGATGGASAAAHKQRRDAVKAQATQFLCTLLDAVSEARSVQWYEEKFGSCQLRLRLVCQQCVRPQGQGYLISQSSTEMVKLAPALQVRHSFSDRKPRLPLFFVVVTAGEGRWDGKVWRTLLMLASRCSLRCGGQYAALQQGWPGAGEPPCPVNVGMQRDSLQRACIPSLSNAVFLPAGCPVDDEKHQRKHHVGQARAAQRPQHPQRGFGQGRAGGGLAEL